MRKIERFLCVTLVAIMILSLAACGKKKTEDSNKNTSNVSTLTSEEMKDYTFKEEELDFINYDGNSSVFMSGDKIYVYKLDYHYAEIADDVALYEEDNLNPDIARTDSAQDSGDVISSEEETVNEEAMTDNADADNQETSEEISTTEGEENANEDEATNGDASEETVDLSITCYQMDGTIVYEYANTYPIESSIYNFKNDNKGNLYFLKDVYLFDDNSGIYSDTYELICIDANGNEKWAKTIGESNGEEDFYVRYLFACKDGIAISTNKGNQIVDADGNITSTAATSDTTEDIGDIVTSSNGKAIAYVYKEDGSYYYEYDIETNKLGQKLDVPNLVIQSTLYSGSISDFVLSTSDGVYLYNLGDKEPVKVMDYIASDLAINGLYMINFTDEKTFVASYYDYNSDREVVSKFVKVDPSEIKDKAILTLGGLWVDSATREAVVEFNKNSDDTKILITDYSVGIEEYTAMISNMNNSIVSGNVPDIILASSELNFGAFASKGLFADLYSFIDNDSEISREDYMQNVLDVCSQNGKLYGICPSFYIQTAFAKKSIVGDKASWTMDEFMNIAKQYDCGKYDFGMITKGEFMDYAISYNAEQYVDWATGKVNFTSEEFANILKYTDKLPLEIDYESDEVNDFWNGYDTLYRDNHALVQISSIYNLKDYNYSLQGTFGEPMALIGFPSASGNGSSINTNQLFCISAKSKYQDNAWKFVREFMLDEYQNKITSGLPIKISSQENAKKLAMEKNYYMDGDEKVYYDDYYSVGGQEIVIEPLTSEQVDEIFDFAKTLTRKYENNEEILKIVNSEAEAYYNGQKSAEDVAKVIQNRVQIYVDENR